MKPINHVTSSSYVVAHDKEEVMKLFLYKSLAGIFGMMLWIGAAIEPAPETTMNILPFQAMIILISFAFFVFFCKKCERLEECKPIVYGECHYKDPDTKKEVVLHVELTA